MVPAQPKPLVSLAGVVILLMAVNGTASWFSLRHATLENARHLDTLAELASLESDAREAQVNFKVQVQEWKNVLLRGGDPTDFERHWGAFEQREEGARAALAGYAERAARHAFDPSLALDLRARHGALGAHYRDALAAFDPDDPESFRAVDERVRGIDRGLDVHLDQLAEDARGLSTQWVEQTREVVQARMKRAETLSLAITTLTVAALLFMLFVLARRV